MTSEVKMFKLSTPELLQYAGKLKYVKSVIGKLYYTIMPETGVSLRDAILEKRAKGLIKLTDVHVKLPLIGYDGEYGDSILNVLRQVPEFNLSQADAFSYKVKKEKGICGIHEVDACVTLYSIESEEI